MGETGVGKTKLLEILATLYGQGKAIFHTLQIHAGTTNKIIVDFIDKINNEVNESIEDNGLTWIFLDEINTCNSLGLITEIICNHSYLGKKINENIIFIAACNPYRFLTTKMKESGLVYYNMKEDNKLNNLVYTVNPLPYSLLNFVFEFGSLKEEDEKKYMHGQIQEGQTNQVNKANQTNQVNQANQTNQANQVYQTNQTAQTNNNNNDNENAQNNNNINGNENSQNHNNETNTNNRQNPV